VTVTAAFATPSDLTDRETPANIPARGTVPVGNKEARPEVQSMCGQQGATRRVLI
jgi:hypothetical protein